ncbi:Tim17-domain-containing protein [Atractiella rhizophila]|nr:Tim17-domain-containing protein [Atractiella rhizophila]
MQSLVPPYIVPGYYPGATDEDRARIHNELKWQGRVMLGKESCIVKATISGGAGFAFGAFFSLMSSSFAYEDPFRAPKMEGLNTAQKTREMFLDMGKGMWRAGKGWGKVGAVFAGTECCIEGYRAKNDIYNAVASGFITGGWLARASGPRATLLGGLGFAAFSGAIDMYLRRDTPDEDA